MLRYYLAGPLAVDLPWSRLELNGSKLLITYMPWTWCFTQITPINSCNSLMRLGWLWSLFYRWESWGLDKRSEHTHSCMHLSIQEICIETSYMPGLRPSAGDKTPRPRARTQIGRCSTFGSHSICRRVENQEQSSWWIDGALRLKRGTATAQDHTASQPNSQKSDFRFGPQIKI